MNERLPLEAEEIQKIEGSEVPEESASEAASPEVVMPELHIRPRMRVLSDDQVQRIHEASLELMEKTGIQVNHEGAREILHSHGCTVDGARVHIPPDLVERALGTVAQEVALYDRFGEKTVDLKEDQTWYGTTLDAYDFLDPSDGVRRPFTMEDCRTAAALADALPNFTWTMTIGVASDAPPATADRLAARQALTACQKPLLYCCDSLQSAKDIHAMAVAVVGSEERLTEKPIIGVFNSPISPLVFETPVMDRVLFAAEQGLPQVCYSGPQAGATSPATLVGTVVQGSVESLFGLLMSQLVRPGAPFVYGAFATIMDMRTSVFSYGAPEMNIMASAMAQMSQYYNIPFLGMSGCSDAKLPDAQSAVEATFSCLCSALSGANLVHDNGWLDHSTLISPEYMVLVNEVIEMVYGYMRGIKVDDERLALDLIDRIGPGGNFLMEDHTMRYFKEIWYSKLFDRSNMNQWRARGKPEFHERLHEVTETFMRHEPAPLPDEVIREIDRMAEHWG
ncbi:MAG: trimethylamine methyltransferase family protein [Desulfobacteraceae bacterium]|jgi:trimethylamine--corrinoid protein Co-methyltransferase